MTGFDWGVVVALSLFAMTQIGGGLWLIATLKAKSEHVDKKLDRLELMVTTMQARFDTQVAAMRNEVHTDLDGIRGQMTHLAVEVGKVAGRQDARG